MHFSSKRYAAEIGLSSCFRQHRAHSHCRFLHGYALAFNFVFTAKELDHNGWVVDFGGLKSLKKILEDTFDHKTIVSEDDPELMWFTEAEKRGILELVILPATGCEKFAEFVYGVAQQWLFDAGFSPRVTLISVEVNEHGANGAMFSPVNVEVSQ